MIDRLVFWRNRGPVAPIVRLRGVIGDAAGRGGGLTLEKVAPALEKAFSFEGAPLVALSINSPGGSPVQSSLIGARIRALAEEKDKKVLAFVEDVAASGGYWLACAADEIYADRCSILGSIGVLYASFGFTEAISKLGVERRLHTAGSKKALLDPFRPESDAGLEMLREAQLEIHGAFKDWVLARRGERLGPSPERLFDGKIWIGGKAHDEGLVDGIGDLRSVLRARLGENLRPRVFKPTRPGLLERLRGAAALATIDALEERAQWARFGL